MCIIVRRTHGICWCVSWQPGANLVSSETGLRFGVPHGYMLEAKNRSGNAAKRSLLVGACVIDSGYDGEVFINLHNVGKESQFIQPGYEDCSGGFDSGCSLSC